MENIRGNTLIINGKAAVASGYRPVTSADLYYEVIRVIKGKFLFLDDHLERLCLSCKGYIDELPDKSAIIGQLRQLVRETRIQDGNVKLIIYKTSERQNTVCFYTSHFYPSDEDYLKGVFVKSYHFERPDPNIKRWNETFRKGVNQFIKDERIYEAILVNEEGSLTEGSRSNLFFIDDRNRLITAPTGIVLPGITRKYVFQICNELGVSVIEQAVSLRNSSSMSACFISGTSPKVLPVQRLDLFSFSADHKIMHNIISSFNQLISDSLS